MSDKLRWSTEQLQEWLDQISYRPDFKFSIYEHEASVLLQIRYNVIDSRDGKSTRTMLAQNSLNIEFFDFNDFVEYVLKCINKLEYHETLEFFKVNGKHWKDPHEVFGEIPNGLP